MQAQSLGQESPLEKEMAPHSSTLAWKIPWTEEPGGLQSMWSQRVGHDQSDLACKQHLLNMGFYSPWDCKELGMAEYCFCFTLFYGREACEILVPHPGLEPAPLARKIKS